MSWSWHHRPLSVAAVKQERQVTRRVQRRAVSGATAAVRAAATSLVEAGAASVTTQELLETVYAGGATYAKVTLIEVVKNEVTDDDGVLRRLRPGVYALRAPGEAPAGSPHPRDWVRTVLAQRHGLGQETVTRVEVEADFSLPLRSATRGVASAVC